MEDFQLALKEIKPAYGIDEQQLRIFSDSTLLNIQ